MWEALRNPAGMCFGGQVSAFFGSKLCTNPIEFGKRSSKPSGFLLRPVGLPGGGG